MRRCILTAARCCRGVCRYSDRFSSVRPFLRQAVIQVARTRARTLMRYRPPQCVERCGSRVPTPIGFPGVAVGVRALPPPPACVRSNRSRKRQLGCRFPRNAPRRPTPGPAEILILERLQASRRFHRPSRGRYSAHACRCFAGRVSRGSHRREWGSVNSVEGYSFERTEPADTANARRPAPQIRCGMRYSRNKEGGRVSTLVGFRNTVHHNQFRGPIDPNICVRLICVE